MANIDNVQLPDGSSYNIVDNTSGFATQNYVDSSVSSVTKTTIGLGNVDNTSDLNKPISTATQTALDAKLSKSEVAPIESTNVASRLYSEDEEFYTSDGVLRVATADINEGASIITSGTGQNCNVAQKIAEQLYGLYKYASANTVVNGTTVDQIVNMVGDNRNKEFYCTTLGSANLPSDYPNIAAYNYVDIHRVNSTLVTVKLTANVGGKPYVWQGFRINNSWNWIRCVGADELASQSKIATFTLPSANQAITTSMADVAGTWSIADSDLYSASGTTLTVKKAGMYAINIQFHGQINTNSQVQEHVLSPQYGGIAPTLVLGKSNAAIQGFGNNSRIMYIAANSTFKLQAVTDDTNNVIYGSSLSPNNFVSFVKLS